MKKLGVGIVGWGNIASVHAQVLGDRHDAELLAVCRRSASRPPDVPADVAIIQGFENLLARDEIDVVVICTPTGNHAEQAIAALDVGKHVVVEKPLARHTSDARAVLSAEQRNVGTLSVISQRRFEPAVIAAREAVESGRLGRLVLAEAILRWYRSADYYQQADWRGTVHSDGGVLLNQGIHVVDLLRWFGGPIVGVQGITTTRTHDIEAEDTAAGTLRFASGAIGLVAATTAAQPGLPGELTLSFEHGRIALTEAGITRWDVPGIPEPELEGSGGTGASNPSAIGSIGHTRQWEDILDALISGRRPAVDGDAGLAALEVVTAIYASNESGQSVSLSITGQT